LHLTSLAGIIDTMGGPNYMSDTVNIHQNVFVLEVDCYSWKYKDHSYTYKWAV